MHIKKIDANDSHGVLLEFEASSISWLKDLVQETPGSGNSWSTRLTQTCEMIGFFKSAGGSLMTAFYQESPVGLMRLIECESSPPFIDLLMAHPGSMGIGGFLIESAVNISEKSGFEGRVSLQTAYGTARAVYEKLGFTRTEDQELEHIRCLFESSYNETLDDVEDVFVLSPDQSNRWSKNEKGEWHLKCS